MKSLMTATVALLVTCSFAHAAQPSILTCALPASKVIAEKGLSRGETTTIKSINLSGTNKNHVGFYFDVEVTTRNGLQFNQVCEIIMDMSDCSYDGTYGCASTLKELNAPQD